MEVVYATFKAHKARSTKPSSSKEVDAAILLNNHVLDMSMSYRKSRRAEAIPPEAPPLLSAEAAPRHLHGSALTRSPPGTPSASTPLRKKGTCSGRCALHLRTGAPPSRNGSGSRRRLAPAVETPCSRCSGTGYAATASKVRRGSRNTRSNNAANEVQSVISDARRAPQPTRRCNTGQSTAQNAARPK